MNIGLAKRNAALPFATLAGFAVNVYRLPAAV
jgi:hypothetical protein